jgi:hypothetical protein
MVRVLSILIVVLIIPIILGNIAMLILFILTTVGLTPDEQLMLTMSSSQINMQYSQSQSILGQITMYQNFTEKLAIINTNLQVIQLQQNGNNISTVVLNDNAQQLGLDLLTYNSTIESQLFVIQEKINNVTLPSSLNLTLFVNTTQENNGSVTWLNPNNPNENTTLSYRIKKQLGTLYIEVDQGSFDYVTVGGMNWTSLVDWSPRIFSNDTIIGGARGQILDGQLLKLPATSREYVAANNEIRFHFDGTAQTITMTEQIEFNVGFL